jgi:hypothetical protein
VDALPSLQVVALHLIDSYEQVGDEISKWLTVPAWQALGPLHELEKKLRDPEKAGNPLISLLLPAIVKVYEAQVRVDRFVAAARGAEALRFHAAGHGGKPPPTWEAIAEVPLPIDPLTGKGMGAFYSVKDGKAVFAVPPPPGMPAVLTKHYELAPALAGEKVPLPAPSANR